MKPHMPLAEIKKNFTQVAADGILTHNEIDAFITLINTHQDALERERIDGTERERKVISSAIWVIFGITMSQFGLIAVLLNAAGLNVLAHWWVFASFAFTFLQTLAVLKVKGWMKEVPMELTHFADVLRALLSRGKKPIPELPPVFDSIPDINPTPTPTPTPEVTPNDQD